MREVYKRTLHPYTLGLLGCVPRIDVDKRDIVLNTIPGLIPRADQLPPGCIFAPRCPGAEQACRDRRPPLEAAEENHRTACRRWQELRRSPAPFTAPQKKRAYDREAAGEPDRGGPGGGPYPQVLPGLAGGAAGAAAARPADGARRGRHLGAGAPALHHGHRRGERLRQDHPGPLHRRPGGGHGGRDGAGRREAAPDHRPALARPAQEDPDGLPESRRLPQSPVLRGGQRGAPPGGPGRLEPGADPGEGEGAVPGGQPAAGLHPPPAPRVERRGEAAGGHRPGLRHRSGPDDLRRADLLPGRVGAGLADEPAGRPAGLRRAPPTCSFPTTWPPCATCRTGSR